MPSYRHKQQQCFWTLSGWSKLRTWLPLQELKFEIKHARTMGIHVSPTTAINDVIFDSSSSWGLAEWQEVLDPLLA